MPIPPPEEVMARIRALPAAAPLLERLRDGSGIYLVGGALRDVLLDGRPVDLDFVVEGDPAAVAQPLGGQVTRHPRFGTCTVALDGVVYDFAMARREHYARPGALPSVEPATVCEDLRRRDFTVNALATELGGGAPGRVLAVPGAIDDLDAGRLRVLHDQSFLDDPTRLFRLARYAARLDFAPVQDTIRLVHGAVDGGALDTVSGDRLGAELRLLAREADPVGGFAWLRRLELDRALEPGFGIADEMLARDALALLPADARQDRLVLALALAGVPRERRRALLDRLGFSAPDRTAIVASAARAFELADRMRAASSRSALAEAADGAPEEAVAWAGALGPREAAALWLDELRHLGLEIDGEDLLAAGVPRGPAVGRALRAALAAKLDGIASGREGELAAALAAVRDGGERDGGERDGGERDGGERDGGR
jgi:tRNA nucleotidyltransferase (CCA-adding enzyme)